MDGCFLELFSDPLELGVVLLFLWIHQEHLGFEGTSKHPVVVLLGHCGHLVNGLYVDEVNEVINLGLFNHPIGKVVELIDG